MQTKEKIQIQSSEWEQSIITNITTKHINDNLNTELKALNKADLEQISNSKLRHKMNNFI